MPLFRITFVVVLFNFMIYLYFHWLTFLYIDTPFFPSVLVNVFLSVTAKHDRADAEHFVVSGNFMFSVLLVLFVLFLFVYSFIV